MSTMRTLLFAALTLAPLSALAQTIYTWTDETGEVHYTDSLTGVPQGVKVDTTEGAELSVVQIEKDRGSGKEVGESEVRPQVAVAPASRTPYRDVHLSVITGDELNEYAWRGRFRSAYGDVARLEDEIAVDQKRMNEGLGGPSYLCGTPMPYQAQPQPYRAMDQVSAMEARATVRPTPGIGVPDTNAAAPQQNYRGRGGYGYNSYNTGCIATPSPEYERLRGNIEKNTAALKRAKDSLDDLDREASHHGVPREWRRP